MNLNDYPTPRTDEETESCRVLFGMKHLTSSKHSRQLEREAAAWRAVADYALDCLNQAAKDEGKPMSLRAASTTGLNRLAHELRDALKSELEKP